jgi:Zn-dependent protease with chaperone function
MTGRKWLTFSDGDRGLAALLAVIVAVGVTVNYASLDAQQTIKLDSYAEWRRPGELLVDGQRVHTDQRTRWKGKVTRLDDVPLGSEVRVEGTRAADGTVLAREIDVRPNGVALFEADVRQGTDELEGLWLRAGEAFEADPRGTKKPIGEIERNGPRVARIERLVRRMAPPYVDRSQIRVYVIDNKEWNAMAMGNGAIWVFDGIMKDMSDDELAIVVGHELAHYTHEHSRRQMRKGMWGQMGSVAALLAAEAIDSNGLRTAAQLGAALGLSAWMSGYGRDLEDQADRVGLRYAHEAGFNVSDAPRVWQRFLEKYGEGDRVTNFFFSDHSLASARRKNLEQEIRNNYLQR